MAEDKVKNSIKELSAMHNDGRVYIKLKNFLGQELIEKYESVLPLLALCEYRMFTYKAYGDFSMMFNTENNSVFTSVYRTALYPFYYLNSFFNKLEKSEKVFLSATILCSDRYIDLIKETQSKHSVASACIASDIPIYSGKISFIKYIKNLFASGLNFTGLAGFTLTGRKLKKTVIKWLEFCKSNEDINQYNFHEADAILSQLSNLYTKKVASTAQKLSGQKISCYITINQYNIRDLIIIHACKALGIVTKQLEHHASRFMYNIYDGVKPLRYCFVDQICCWNDSEVDFHKKIYNYQVFLSETNPQIYSVGNPEISYSKACESLEKYPLENKVIFMVSGLLDTADPERVEGQLKFRNEIYRRLYKLSEEKGYKIRVRYPPGLDMDVRHQEENMLKKYGFEISPSDRRTLMSDICSSKAVIGTISSVLGLCALMGKDVYKIAGEKEEYYITDKNIRVLPVNRIESITFQQNIYGINKEEFFDLDKLLLSKPLPQLITV